MKRILLPVDGSTSSTNAVEKAAVLAKTFDSDVTMLYVIGAPEGDMIPKASGILTEQTIDKEHEQAKAIFDSYLSHFDREVEQSVKIGNIAETIVTEAENGHYDIVVMGTQGMGSPLKRFLVGSVTKQVLTRVEQPVLVVR